MRAAPFGVFAAGRPAEAARLVAIDGTRQPRRRGHLRRPGGGGGRRRRDGGRGPARGDRRGAVRGPEDSWTARSLRRAVARLAPTGRAAMRTGGALGGRHRRLPVDGPGPGGGGPGLRRVRGGRRRLPESVLTAVNMGRDADTTAAVAGALAGATRRRRGDPGGVGVGDRPGARQLPAVDGGLPRPGHRGAAHSGRGRRARARPRRPAGGR